MVERLPSARASISGQGRAARVRRMGWATTVAWIAGAVALVALPVSYAAAVFSSSGIDPEDDCKVGQPFVPSEVFLPDGERKKGGTRWFPLGSACDADDDMVPAWVKPTVVAAAVTPVASAVALVVLAVLRRRARRVLAPDPRVW